MSLLHLDLLLAWRPDLNTLQYFRLIQFVDTGPKTMKYLGIAALLLGTAVGGIYLKNKLQQSHFRPLERGEVLEVIKKARKQNYVIMKKIAAFAVNMSQQVQQISPEMLKGYLESAESPVRIPYEFEKTYQRICQQNNIRYGDFSNSVDYYVKKKDQEIVHYIQLAEKDFETALTGRLPQPKVNVPSFLTKEKVLEVQKKLTLKKYLIQLEMYRKLKGHSRQKIAEDTELLKSLPNPEEEEEKILEDEGLGVNDNPAAVVFASALMQYKNDSSFTNQIANIEKEYKKIYTKFLPKMQQHKITEEELNDLEYELIYSQADF